MFLGVVPPALRSMIRAHADHWHGSSGVWLGCSGNFTIHRVLADTGLTLHGNDVSLYSCAIGTTYAQHVDGIPMPDGKMRIDIKPEHQEAWGWLVEWMATPVDQLATVLLASTMLNGVTRPEASRHYFEQMWAEYRRQWPVLHSKTAERLRKARLPLATFFAGDVVDFVRDAPDDSVQVLFPPFDKGSYEAQYRHLEAVFDWDTPSYEIMGEDGLQAVFDDAATKRYWLFGNDVRRGDWHEHLRGKITATRGSVTIYVYSNTPGTVMAKPGKSTRLSDRLRLRAGDTLEGPLRLVELKVAEFQGIRSAYMNNQIPPGTPWKAVAVYAADRMIGAFAWKNDFTFDTYLPGPTLYLLSDFPVSGTDYPRLSKLIVMAAMSAESKMLLERWTNQRARSLATTAFSKNPQSMKYRGLLKLLKRTGPKPDAVEHNERSFKLSYGSELGQWTLAEALDTWRAKHGQRKETANAAEGA